MSLHEEKGRVARAAGVVGLATLASRITGFLRDMVVAYLFGAGPAADAFFVAFRIPNLLRRLFAEGTLAIAFIPVFTETLHRKGREEACLLFRATGSLLALALLLVCLAGYLWAEPVVRAMAPGFAVQGESLALAVLLTRWCLPYIFFISLTALAGGVLNSLGHFLAPAGAPVLLNLAMIACALVLAPWMEPPVLALALGVILGGVLQLGLQVPALRTRGVSLRPAWNPGNPALRRVLKLLAPAAFGAAVYQVTVVINTILASLLPTGSVSYLYYADRLIEFPLGVFAIALSTAVLPSLSRQAAQGDLAALRETLSFSLRLTLFINLPAMVGLLVLAEPLITLLFARGSFDQASARATAQALVGYGVGLWAFAGVRAVVPAFYALKDTRTPVLVAVGALVVNLAAALPLMAWLAHGGLALASSLASVANLAGLLWLLRRRLGRLDGRRLLRSVGGMLLASGGMALVVGAAGLWLGLATAPGLLARTLGVLGVVALGVLAYLAAAWGLGLPEPREVLAILRKRRAS